MTEMVIFGVMYFVYRATRKMSIRLQLSIFKINYLEIRLNLNSEFTIRPIEFN